MKRLLKSLLPESLIDRLKCLRQALMFRSLKSAIAEQGFEPLVKRLSEAVPDIRAQYTGFPLDTEYLVTKVRGQHALQIWLTEKALNGGAGAVADIGDSNGTHIEYLKALYPGHRRFVSVNLDEAAVGRIRARGLEAVHGRAEELDKHGIDADVFLCFETLEHLSDPFTFLHNLSSKTSCRRLALTVPYVRQSRVGLHHIREGQRKKVGGEATHILELSPEDLRLLFKHTGWRLEVERIYLQYPRKSWLRALAPLWRKEDFEGFYGAVLTRDDSWSSLYADWR